MELIPFNQPGKKSAFTTIPRTCWALLPSSAGWDFLSLTAPLLFNPYVPKWITNCLTSSTSQLFGSDTSLLSRNLTTVMVGVIPVVESERLPPPNLLRSFPSTTALPHPSLPLLPLFPPLSLVVSLIPNSHIIPSFYWDISIGFMPHIGFSID